MKWLLPLKAFSSKLLVMTRGGSVSFSLRVILLFGILGLQIALPVDGRSLQTKNQVTTTEASGANVHPVLVELFTSEGCSSCPPADALLLKMDASQPIAGAELIVLSEHVDYWDHDGWKDQHSSPMLTDRQDSYVHALGLKTAYTPQFIVDGTTEMLTGDPQQMEKVLQEAATKPKVPVHIGEVSVDAENPSVLRAHVEADGNSATHGGDVYVAVALDHVESQVLHGENGGRHLTHVAVVLQLTKVGKLPKGKNFAETVQLRLKPGTDLKDLRIVAFVQETGPGRLLGAALRKPR
jgi:hypothetical protein